MDEGFIKKLVVTIECGVCGEHYEDEHVRVIGHRDDLWFLSVFCPVCKSQGLVAAVIEEGELSCSITDLSETEEAKFCSLESVSADELLDLHLFLEDFDGDFARLFSGK